MYRPLVRSWKCLIKQFNPHPIRWGFLFSSVFKRNTLYYSYADFSSTLFLTCSILVTLICEKKRIFTCKK